MFGPGRHPKAARVDGYTLLPLEITSNESVATCIAEVQSQTNEQLDVLVNNVGTGILGAAEESSAEQVRQLFDINFFGATGIAGLASTAATLLSAVIGCIHGRPSASFCFLVRNTLRLVLHFPDASRRVVNVFLAAIIFTVGR